MHELIQYGFAAAIGGVFSLVALILNRHWQKKDSKEAGNEAVIKKLSDVEKRITDMDTKLDNHIHEDKVEKAKATRTRILRYNDELLNGVVHSKEMADACLIDCTYYENACTEIKNFKNNIATMAIKNIKRDYAERMETNTFL